MLAFFDQETQTKMMIAKEREDAAAKAEEKKAKAMALKMFKRGDSPSDIAEMVEYPLGTVEKWLGLVTA